MWKNQTNSRSFEQNLSRTRVILISFVVFAFANATDDVPNPAINAIATKIFLIIVIF